MISMSICEPLLQTDILPNYHFSFIHVDCYLDCSLALFIYLLVWYYSLF